MEQRAHLQSQKKNTLSIFAWEYLKSKLICQSTRCCCILCHSSLSEQIRKLSAAWYCRDSRYITSCALSLWKCFKLICCRWFSRCFSETGFSSKTRETQQQTKKNREKLKSAFATSVWRILEHFMLFLSIITVRKAPNKWACCTCVECSNGV